VLARDCHPGGRCQRCDGKGSLGDKGSLVSWAYLGGRDFLAS